MSAQRSRPNRSFAGFPAGRLRATPLPDLFFVELLPLIDDVAELKLTLHLFWLVHRRRRELAGVSLPELLDDHLLQQSLRSLGEPETLVRRGLDAAVERGTLLHLAVDRDGGVDDWFFLNTEAGRASLKRVASGDLDLGGAPLVSEGEPEEERPNIFTLYEQNIGLLQPLIVEELSDAERSYPAEWIEEAFRIAVENNVRRWRYIRAILERWRTEGRTDEAPGRDYREDGRSYLKGKYADFIKH